MELQQTLRFAPTPSGARIAWAATGRGPAVVRPAHWMTHIEHDHRSPIFGPWLQRLSASMRLVRYDGRGCGLSETDGTAPGLEAGIEELGTVIDAAGLASTTLLGISAGAAVAIEYAARHPARVSRLVICGGYARGPMRRSLSPELVRYHEAAAQLIETGWGRRNPAVLQLFTTLMIPDGSPEQVRALNDQQRLSCDAARAAALYRASWPIDVTDKLGGLRCPTLVMHCAGDAAVPIEEGRLLAASIPGAAFEVLPSNNHLPMPGEPAFERFCDALRAFVGDDPPAGAAPDWALTARERELVALVGRGLDNLQIAAHMGIAEKTVRNALSRLYAKLGVEGRAQAIVRAREAGYGGS